MIKRIISNIKNAIRKAVRRFWYRRVYLRSPAWDRTRTRILRRDGRRCQKCGSQSPLNVHHVTYNGLPIMRWWHFLPFARWFIDEIDVTSELKTLCIFHHRAAHGLKK